MSHASFDEQVAQDCVIQEQRNGECRQHEVWPPCLHQGTFFGVDGTKKRVEFCSESTRKEVGHHHHGCSKKPSFGVDRSKVVFFSEEKKHGIVDLKNKRWVHPGCVKVVFLWL